MNIVITMAGNGSRFRNIGIQKPKHEIIANGKTLFEWSLSSLSNYFNHNFIFIIKESDYSENLKKICKKINIKSFSFIKIDNTTSGQAETFLLASKKISKDESTLVYNIDTLISKPLMLTEEFLNSDASLVTFKAPGNHWSFVHKDENDKVIKVTEKKEPSPDASVGVYYFKNFDDFAKSYADLKEWVIEEYSETYIAPFYNWYINKGKKINVLRIPYSEVIPLGTPKELTSFANEWENEN